MSGGKRYLLLRNNIQSGPYTYNEIRKQSIRPSDLIWIEGESTSWTKPRFGATREPHAKDGRAAPESFRTLATPREKSAAEPVAYSLQGSDSLPFYGPSQPGDTAFIRRSRTPVEDADIELVLHRADKNTVSLSQLLFAAVVTAASVLVWNNRFSFMPDGEQNITVANTPEVFRATPPPRINPVAPVNLISDTARSETTAVLTNPPRDGAQKRKAAKPVAKTEDTQITKKDTPILTLPVAEVKVEEVPAEPVVAAPPPPAVVSETGEKKKTLGQAIKGLFKKKKKKDASEEEEQ